MRIGIDLGGTKTEGVLLSESGQLVARERRPTPAADGYRAVVDNIVALVGALEREAGARCRVGIGTPGALSTRTGRMKNANTVCLNDQPLGRDLEQRLGREIRIENDANCFALSEAVDGAARGHGMVFGVIMGTGVGGGIVYRKQLLPGLQHIAGEWGHNVLDPSGPPCYCGRHGCVETYISGPGLARDYLSHGGQPDLDAPAIAARAAAGEPAAVDTMARFLDRFGRALATVINILDPDAVVLGGGLSCMELLYSEGPGYVTRHVFNDELRTPILPNAHGDSSGVRGAAWLWPGDEE